MLAVILQSIIHKITKLFTFATKFLWTPEIAKREISFLDPNKIIEKLPAFAKVLEQRHYATDWKIVLQKTSNILLRMGDKNVLTLKDFENFEMPVKLGIGDKDTMVTLEETIEIYRSIINAELLLMSKTQHPIEKISLGRLKMKLSYFSCDCLKG